MKLVKGSELTPTQKEHVKAAYLYRLTHENEQIARASYAAHGFDFPTVPLISDEQWLNEYAFYVNKDGSLSKNRNFCVPAYVVEGN